MNLWINIARKDLLNVMKKVDLMVLNDQEVKLLTGMSHLEGSRRAVFEAWPEACHREEG